MLASQPRKPSALFALTLALYLSGVGFVSAQESRVLKWEIRPLTVDQNEGIDLADINHDGRLDVAAGRNWYPAPDFVPRPLRILDDWSGYVLSNGDFAFDINRDGWIDIISGPFAEAEAYWFENPGKEGLARGQLWAKKLLLDRGSATNEGQLLQDIDGDGVPEWFVNSWTADTPMIVWRFHKTSGSVDESAYEPEPFLVGPVNGHGLGLGDLNGDGAVDLLFEGGWYESPAGDPFSKPWKLHPDWNLDASLPMLVRDLNGDGRNDVVYGLAHDYGLFWLEQKPSSDETVGWVTHLIDRGFSQVHALLFVDLDGDGREELVTGKRVFAHNGQDPGANDPPCLYYYRWDRNSLQFYRQTIDEGRVGAGLQIRAGDLNGDGWIDLAVAGKSGTFLLFNQGF